MIKDQRTNCQSCDPSNVMSLERTRFFSRQLVMPADLTEDQDFFRAKLRRHNRMLHGWGIVCGANVKRGQQPCTVIVEPGYIIGPYGDEICIDREVTVDLCKEDTEGNAISPCAVPLDPWCSDIRVDRQPDRPLYLAVRYDECHTRPVRTYPAGCGCDEADCEYSRIRDSYVIKVLTRLPSTYDPMPTSRRYDRCAACAPCPAEAWVILADITLNREGQVNILDSFHHRRYIASFAEFFFRCHQIPIPRLPVPDFPGIHRLVPVSHGGLLSIHTEREEVQPPTAIPLRRADGTWTELPVHFTAVPGETYEHFLEREGDRAFVDPINGERFTLRELYEAAGVMRETKIEDPGDALIPLEGLHLRGATEGIVRSRLETLLDKEGIDRLEREHGGSPDSAGDLPATALRGISPDSHLGTHLRDTTVTEVAGMTREDFVDSALENVPEERAQQVRRQANEVWTRAAQVVRLSKAWRE